jgi:hypothetical protein
VPVLPPRAEHFYSYVELGRTLPGALYLRLSSVSMYLSRDQLHRARAERGLPPEDVELDLRRDRNITYAVTNERTGHIEVGAPPEALLACVVGVDP